MKTIVVAALLALSFTTGFTCSKNTPAPEAAAPAPEATPAVTPAEGTPAAPADATAAPAPTEAAPAAPAGETH